ncbi:hypothetical protein Q4574_11455 [Aliiglaciecola sp. 3_MG-2023]|uniref:hypothetical protein n=1 Tax=Aliiglaciecola sp. 3_MG-2023 TaxID=3062644 RepID=UPI0026E32310|nr:hypothetical protein [Aliiglaciecola sp. 3_MG-2023]MDO6693903.1 hypothetical protein [Aliiglaciecola sp. 3_MG-2023]
MKSRLLFGSLLLVLFNISTQAGVTCNKSEPCQITGIRQAEGINIGEVTDVQALRLTLNQERVNAPEK